MKCTKRRKDGQPCGAQAVDGTNACQRHAGVSLAAARAKGAVVLELRSWGLDDELVDSTQAMLRLLAQSYRRAQHYSQLLQEAYEAAERLRAADGDTQTGLPPHADNDTDRDRAIDDLARVFNDGGIAALIGIKWGAAGKDGHLYQAEEAIRGLARLEAEERDRAFRFAKECRGAGLDERLVALAEQQGRLVADVLMGALADLQALLAAGQIASLDPAQPAVARVVSERLLALGSAA